MKNISFLIALALLFVIARPALVQSRRVTGTVRDAETGQPLGGASVLVRGQQTGTTTDASITYRSRLTKMVYNNRVKIAFPLYHK